MDYDYLSASDGTGDAALMHVNADRSIGDTTLHVDSVNNVPAKFLGTSGTLLSTGFIDPATKVEFKGHVNGSNLEIDGFEPGFADIGNTSGQIVVIRPTTGWADRVATFIKTFTNRNDGVPAGATVDFAGSTAPSGWLMCYGQAVSRSTYAALFTAIGTTYGVGDNSTTFNLPDARGRVIAGKDNMGGVSASRLTGQTGGVAGSTLGASGGEEQQTLSTAQMPVHSHQWKSGGAIVQSGAGVSGIALNTAGFNVNGPTTDAGNGSPHNNVQPTLVMNKIIKI